MLRCARDLVPSAAYDKFKSSPICVDVVIKPRERIAEKFCRDSALDTELITLFKSNLIACDNVNADKATLAPGIEAFLLTGSPTQHKKLH